MAGKNNTEQGYSTDLHIRLKTDERDILQKRANELGLTLSQAARRIIFRRLDGSEMTPGDVSPKEAHLRTLQGVQSLKTHFKKISTDVGKLVAGYERSLLMTNRNGEPAVNSTQTLRTVESVVLNQIKLQDGLNEVIRILGGSEIHVAAKPPVGTAVGAALAGVNKSGHATKTAPAIREPEQENDTNDNNNIPINFKHMFNVTFDGVLLADVEMYNDGHYDKIRLQLKVELYRNGTVQTNKIDAVDFASRYKNVMKYLKKDKMVFIAGELDFSAGTYNGTLSDAVATVEIKTLTLPKQ